MLGPNRKINTLFIPIQSLMNHQIEKKNLFEYAENIGVSIQLPLKTPNEKDLNDMVNFTKEYQHILLPIHCLNANFVDIFIKNIQQRNEKTLYASDIYAAQVDRPGLVIPNVLQIARSSSLSSATLDVNRAMNACFKIEQEFLTKVYSFSYFLLLLPLLPLPLLLSDMLNKILFDALGKYV